MGVPMFSKQLSILSIVTLMTCSQVAFSQDLEDCNNYSGGKISLLDEEVKPVLTVVPLSSVEKYDLLVKAENLKNKQDRLKALSDLLKREKEIRQALFDEYDLLKKNNQLEGETKEKLSEQIIKTQKGINTTEDLISSMEKSLDKK